MDEHTDSALLDELSSKIDVSIEEVDDDRRMFFDGIVHLREGRVERAAKIFRRAVRRCEPPFSVMSKMAHARCEVVRGHQGAALRIFRSFAVGEHPESLRKMAWMEIADLARRRDNDQLLDEARSEIAKLG